MLRTYEEKTNKEYKVINFNHLMSIYETNFHNFKQILSTNYLNSNKKLLKKRAFTLENIYQDKYTRIFKMYHKFSYDEQLTETRIFSIKPHLIFYMYNDAQLLEVKSLKDNKTFENSISHKIKLNLNLFYWIKSHINQ